MADKKEQSISWFLYFLNTFALLLTLGFFYYSKIVYKRTPITEESERQRLARRYHGKSQEEQPDWITFEKMTVNLAPTMPLVQPQSSPTPTVQGITDIDMRKNDFSLNLNDSYDKKLFSKKYGKNHYLTLEFTLEIRDQKYKDLMESFRSQIIDHLITLLSKKYFHELNHVQGRYQLSSLILDFMNQEFYKVRPEEAGRDIATQVYYTEFIIQ